MQFAKMLLLVIGFQNAVNANESKTHRYDLPTSKQYLPACHSQALVLYSGMIEKQTILRLENHFFVQYDIQMPNKATRTVICDLNNGQILQTQTLADFQ
ncbi:MAG: hypothetical protein WBI40_01620 [Methylococcaceae bacterium]